MFDASQPLILKPPKGLKGANPTPYHKKSPTPDVPSYEHSQGGHNASTRQLFSSTLDNACQYLTFLMSPRNSFSNYCKYFGAIKSQNKYF